MAERRQNVPDFRLAIDGKDLTGKVRPRLISLRLTEKRAGEADELEIQLDDTDGLLAIPRKGAKVSLSIGWARGSDVAVGLVDKGVFTVDQTSWQSAPAQISITARSADLTAGYRVRRERSHRSTTLGAIARKVASANGLQASVSADLADIPIAMHVQDQKSDMAMIRSLGRRYDAVATVKHGKLILAPIGAGKTAGGKPIPTLAITPAEGDRVSWQSAERDSYTKVEARWHDRGSASRKTESADVGTGSASSDGKTRRLHRTYHSQATAKAAAKAEAKRIGRAAGSLSYRFALGRADVYPDRRASVKGFKPGIDSDNWLVTETTHAIDGQGGFVTETKLELGN